jgi:hypothetical protein
MAYNSKLSSIIVCGPTANTVRLMSLLLSSLSQFGESSWRKGLTDNSNESQIKRKCLLPVR